MTAGPFVTRFRQAAIGVLMIASFSPSHVLAQHDQTQAPRSRHHGPDADRRPGMGPFVKLVRESTERLRDVAVAEAEGYKLLFGCVNGPDYGAMGLHYVNLPLVMDDVLDPTRPEIVIYEPTPHGRPRLIGADYLIYADVWHKKNPTTTPELMGQLMHLFESPNRFGLASFYTLHVWAWKENPDGAFVNWHPNVSCEPFTPQQ